MSITFYAASGSPYAWKVWLALEHKGLAYDLRMLSFSGGDLRKPEYASINPRMKVPAVVVDGTFSLYESSAIVEYLAEKYADVGPRLFPEDVEKRAVARRIAAEADAYLYPAWNRLARQTLFRRDGDGDPKEIAAGKSDLGLELERVERLMTDGWLVNGVSVADLALYPMLGMVRRLSDKHPSHSMIAQIGPMTRAWMERVEALPYFDRTYPPHWRA